MKRIRIFAIPLSLLALFLAVLILSPDSFPDQSGFENYVKVSEMPVPENGIQYLNVVNNAPKDVAVENSKGDTIELWVSRTLNQNQRDYYKEHLKVELETLPDGKTANLTIRLDGRLVLFKGEDWLAVRMFQPYKDSYEKAAPLFKVVVP